MPRIPPIENTPLPFPQMSASGSASDSGIDSMSTLFQVMAHRPDLARHSRLLLEAAMHTGTVDTRLKELLAVRVSQVNHCFY